MTRFETVTMILAGGQGSRLGVLTKKNAKPAVRIGGKYRIIDFTISNCFNADLTCIGVLTQYKPHELNNHIRTESAGEAYGNNGEIAILPPYMSENEGSWYLGTADAIAQNINFIDKYSPTNVLVLSGDHVYRMDYSKIIQFHNENRAHATISVLRVPIREASSFGVLNVRPDYSIYEFEEKPKEPKSDLVSMGIYVFGWRMLRKYLLEDMKDKSSSHDFGKDILPRMLAENCRMFAYPFDGYWKDVGTIESYWGANMDFLREDGIFCDRDWTLYSKQVPAQPSYFSSGSQIKNSIVCDGCLISGSVKGSIISPNVIIDREASVSNSIIMSSCCIQSGCVIENAIICDHVNIGKGTKIGAGENTPSRSHPGIYNSGITVVGNQTSIPPGTRIGKNVMIDCNIAYKDFNTKEIESGSSIIKEVFV